MSKKAIGIVTAIGILAGILLFGSGADAATLQKVNTISSKTSVYLWSNGSVKKVRLSDNKVLSKFTFPTTGTVKGVAYNDATNAIAYITTSGNTDTLKFRYRGSDTFWRLDKVTRGSSEVERALHYGSVSFIGNTYVKGTVGFWEGCADRVFSRSSKKKVYDDWCGSLGVSPDNARYVKTASMGIATGSQFNVATSINGTYTPLDWTTMKGDTDLVYDSTKKQLIAGFEGHAFLTNRKVIVNVLRDDNTHFLALVDLSGKRITKLVDVAEKYYSAPTLVGRRAVLVNDRTIGVYHLDTKVWTEYSIDAAYTNDQYAYLSLAGASTDVVMVVLHAGYTNNAYTTQRLIAVNQKSGAYIDLGNATKTFFAGIATK